MNYDTFSPRSRAPLLLLGCLTMFSACSTVHQKFIVDPNEIRMIPVNAASDYLVPILAKAVNERTGKITNCILDETGISCKGKRYPLTEWRIIENASIYAKDTGEIRIYLVTRNSLFKFGRRFGPTGKGWSLYLVASNKHEAEKTVSALKSLGVASFPGADSK